MVTLVLLPGMDGTGLLFSDFIAAMGSDVEIIVVTYPTDIILDYFELEKIARTLLPVDRPFLILGESFSGPIAISLAAAKPAGLVGLILCCTFAKNPQPLLAVVRPFVGLLPVAAVPLSLLGYLLMGRFFKPELERAYAHALKVVSPAVLKNRLHAVLSVDVTACVSTISVPVLYLRATEDKVVPRACSLQIAKLMPKLWLVDIIAPHFLLQTAPIKAASAVFEFIRAKC